MWTDPEIEDISPIAKLLYIYLGANNHKNTAGLYKISLKRMADETGIEREQIPGALEELKGVLKYDSENQIVWVKDHVRGQFMKTANISPKIIISIRKALLTLPTGYAMIGEFLDYYKVLHIEYPYPIDKVSIKGMCGVSVGYPYLTGEGEGKGGGVNTSHTDESLEESKDLKYSYGTYENVFLTKDEEIELINKAGNANMMDYIERLSAHIQGLKKGDPYDSEHCSVIIKWLLQDGKYKPKKRQGPKLDEKEKARANLTELLRMPPKSVTPETLKKWAEYHKRWPGQGWEMLLNRYKAKPEPERKSTPKDEAAALKAREKLREVIPGLGTVKKSSPKKKAKEGSG